MPQDSFRSGSYRSFVTCGDPKGVADCKTIKNSKKINNASTSHNSEKRKEEKELQNLSCLQMMEVSRGAQKLNEVVINSLSNRASIDRPSKQIASELLRGALDLQESLVMLGKLQEASKYIADSTKRKKKEKRPNFCRVGGAIEAVEFEKQRISSAPKDCYDELREVIRESFARQNLLPKERLHEIDKRHSESCVDLPSSSTSQSYSSGCSSSSIRHERMQGPNLIAKLMGLEEVPSNGVGFKKMEKEWSGYGRGPLLDIDLPRPKKPQFMVQKVVREKRTLEEIMETIQFKGILGRNSLDGSNDCRCYYNPSFRRDIDGPPIVIMKPLRGDRDEEQINEQEQMKNRQMVRRLKVKEPKQKVDKGNERKNSGGVGAKAVKKTLDSLSAMKTNHSKPVVPPMQKKEVVPRKIDRIPKAATNKKKPTDTKDVDKARDSAKLAAVKYSRNVRENNVSKSPNISRTKAAPKKKGESNNKKSSALVKSTESDDNSAISAESNIEEAPLKNLEPEQNPEEVARASCMSGTENAENRATSPSDSSSPITTYDLNNIEDEEECIQTVDSDEIKGCKTTITTTYLLLNSVTFLNHVEDLFDIMTEAHSPETETIHDPLILDCSKEMLGRKSLHWRMTGDQWSQHLLRKPKCHLSIEKVVEDICDGIEYLQEYSKSCGGVVVPDSIYTMLEKDLRWNEEVTGAWDMGWRKGYDAEAVGEVMHDVEELVLSEIIDDVIIEIV